MWDLQGWFTRHRLVTIFRVTSEMTLQLILYQYDMLLEGDEWVTSALKWITVVIFCVLIYYNVMGDELQSSMKNLFFWVECVFSYFGLLLNCVCWHRSEIVVVFLKRFTHSWFRWHPTEYVLSILIFQFLKAVVPSLILRYAFVLPPLFVRFSRLELEWTWNGLGTVL